MPKAAVPPPPAPIGGRRAATFQEEVIAMIPADSRLEACIQCGTCGGSCPSYADMDHTPRQIFALIRAGARDKVMDSNTPWMCVSCYLCAVRCPQQIHIPDVMYALKAKATQEDRVPSHVAPDFSQDVRRLHPQVRPQLRGRPRRQALPAPLHDSTAGHDHVGHRHGDQGTHGLPAEPDQGRRRTQRHPRPRHRDRAGQATRGLRAAGEWGAH